MLKDNMVNNNNMSGLQLFGYDNLSSKLGYIVNNLTLQH